MSDDAEHAIARLAGAVEPFLIGVRHHSPACALAMPRWLDAFAPTHVALELAADLQPWIEWLGHPELVPPVALASVSHEGSDLVFHPFAEFSPELAAIRWARAKGVPVSAFDQPLGERDERIEMRADSAPTIADRLVAQHGVSDTSELWDRMVEAPAVGADPEAIRRAALLFGWALRRDAEQTGVPSRDLARERFMRARLAALRASGARIAAVVGSFHAAALLDDAVLPDENVPIDVPEPDATRVSSLVPYTFELFDSRSGYPAGVLDPAWHQRVLECGSDPAKIAATLRRTVVEVCRAMREKKHVAGVPDANEAVRVALDLAQLRGLHAPSRRELLEGLESALAQGEPLGRGRALAAALGRVMVGHERGRLPPGAPRSGLVPHVLGLLEELRLPSPSERLARYERAPRLRLDVLGSTLDRRRKITLERLALVGAPYARRIASEGPFETLTEVWEITLSPATEAMLELAAVRGVTLAQAAEGTLRIEEARLEQQDARSVRARLALLERAAEAGLVRYVERSLPDVQHALRTEGALRDLVAGASLFARARAGHVPGLPIDVDVAADVPRFTWPADVDPDALELALAGALEGLAGSDDEADAHALVDSLALIRSSRDGVRARATDALKRLFREGAPLIEGAAGMTLVSLDALTPEAMSRSLGSWVDAAVDRDGQRRLARRLRGALIAGASALEGDPSLLGELASRIETIGDREFLARAPALRDGFEVLSPAARSRFLESLIERHGSERADFELTIDPALLALHAEADLIARDALGALGLAMPSATSIAIPEATSATRATGALSARDRWRIVLGRDTRALPPDAMRAARALDELYGPGRGEGSRAGGGAGLEPSFPTTREWSDELEALFGESVRDEVLARAGAEGRVGALLELDPETVTPSIELLESVLSLKGALPEAQLGRLRRLVERVTRELVDQLATRVRPALVGLTTPRPTLRSGGPIDLDRTIRRNLRTARFDDGVAQLAPERLVFRTRSRRSLDWRVILVVDVSGSMEPSVIYSAMMASILGALPAIETSFVAFSTEVVDLSHRVDDPLGLLLEVRVGGGTDIAKALRYARSLATVPSRTLMVLVSDLDEGGPVPSLVAEVRALAESGVTLLGLAALDDAGKPRYERAIAERLVAAGMPVAALTPLELARWVGEKVR
ncbi:DUF5682 family protein [Sandaracinus amylolyticus]|uniref:DUF5682 family protein n=1 Tax=Sandaracinus amylolyticus TaxID=927083 RepID=UPI001F347990|nr:DUF5682 family protein [Sandaracinus amylolyticus]UJR85119.1 Hypothetical protein I5071_71990 [Sandaracinus amylolyticus]